MKKFVCFLAPVVLTLSLVGCAEPEGDVVGSADVSAIEAYEQAQAADMAAMESSMQSQVPAKKKATN